VKVLNENWIEIERTPANKLASIVPLVKTMLGIREISRVICMNTGENIEGTNKTACEFYIYFKHHSDYENWTIKDNEVAEKLYAELQSVLTKE
jgi:hypothetical protein